MQELLVMDLEDSVDHLRSQEQRCLDSEFPLAHLEEVLKRLTQEVHDHYVVFSFGTVGVDGWYSNVL